MRYVRRELESQVARARRARRHERARPRDVSSIRRPRREPLAPRAEAGATPHLTERETADALLRADAYEGWLLR